MNELKVIQTVRDGDNITFTVEPNFPLPQEMRIGCDPGTRNMGVAVIRPNKQWVHLHKIVLERHKKALLRLLNAQKVLAHAIGPFTANAKAIIEGASYGDRFRQVEMAEQRAAFLLYFHAHGIEAELVPPLTIRRVSFGSGKIKNPWPEIDNNMIAALGCALYTP